MKHLYNTVSAFNFRKRTDQLGRTFCVAVLLLVGLFSNAQNKDNKEPGIIIGAILDADNGKALSSVTVTLKRLSDSLFSRAAITVKDGAFLFEQLPFGYYRLQISMIGYSALRMDSIYLRAERFDFDLNDIKLHKRSTDMDEVIIYAEKPLIESKDGKITFNAGESALSAAASTTELLKQTPLVNVDNDGKILLRGKDVKILIDDKPVDLNAKQLQDLLESMPGSMIEKIEVMTTPPPQYANERGGVINIVTKKGKVGKSARLNLNYGTRGEAGISGNLSYRKKKISINFSAGFGYNEYIGNSYSNRTNLYIDSTNYFNTVGNSNSNNHRPNARLGIDYDLSKRHILNFTVQYNANDAGSANATEYTNINRNYLVYKLSNRYTGTANTSHNPGFNFTYTYKGKNPKESFRFISGFNMNVNDNERNYFQQYLNPDYTPNGIDSTQRQQTAVHNNSLSFRINYDKPLKGNKTLLNFGAYLNRYNNHNELNTSFLKKPDNIMMKNDLLSNDFRFHQLLYSLRAAIRYDFVPDFFINAGIQAEHTQTHFDIVNNTNHYLNDYWTPLPFATLMKKWKNEISITLSYKRTIQRPGLNELNPSVDYSDPYNTRFGNPYLQAYSADNFDFIIGKWNKAYYLNASLGYNALQDIYSAIRSLQPDGKTTITWQNLSGRKEYEANTWGGYTLSKKSKINLSLGFTHNVYSAHDKLVNKFRDGSSFFSTLNGSYQFNDRLNSNASLTFNRFANPQGTVRNTLSMNIGVQQKFFHKKFIVALNVIDPFRQQQNKSFTWGTNFNLESYSTTNTRNFRIALSYIFSKSAKLKLPIKKTALKK